MHDLLAPDCHTVNPIFGDKKASRQEWEETLKDVFRVRAETVALGEQQSRPAAWGGCAGAETARRDTIQRLGCCTACLYSCRCRAGVPKSSAVLPSLPPARSSGR